MTMAITVFERMQDPLQAVERLGLIFAKSRMFGVESAEQGAVLALACMSERLSPTSLLKKYHMIEGRLSRRADDMQAEFQARGGRIKWLRYDGQACEAEFSSPFSPAPVKIAVTLEQLVKAGVAVSPKTGQLKVVYQRHPQQMLRARVVSEGVRMIDPGAICGEYSPEEIEDGDHRDDNEAQASQPAASVSKDPPEVYPALPAPTPKAAAPEVAKAGPGQEKLSAPQHRGTQAQPATPAAVDTAMKTALTEELDKLAQELKDSRKETVFIATIQHKPAAEGPTGGSVSTQASPPPQVEVKPRTITTVEVGACLSEYGKICGKTITQIKEAILIPIIGQKTVKESNQDQRLRIISAAWKAYPEGGEKGPRIAALVAELKSERFHRV